MYHLLLACDHNILEFSSIKSSLCHETLMICIAEKNIKNSSSMPANDINNQQKRLFDSTLKMGKITTVT